MDEKNLEPAESGFLVGLAIAHLSTLFSILPVKYGDQ